MEKEIYIPRHLKRKSFEVENEKHQKKPAGNRRLSAYICLITMALILFIVSETGSPDANKPKPEEDVSTNLMPVDYRNQWLKNKAINPDYVGEIVFDSGLVSLSFVQAKDVYDHEGKPYVFYAQDGSVINEINEYTGNDVYIWKNWKNGEYDRYEEGGSIFMYYRNSLNDQNLIIYGHHFARDFDPSGNKQFTPLDILLKEENYEKNSTLKLILDNEIRSYQVCAVLILNAKDEKHLQIARPDLNYDLEVEYDPEFVHEYITLIDQLSVYHTGTQIDGHDRFLTLITCIEHQPDLRQAVICRETGVIKYEAKEGQV